MICSLWACGELRRIEMNVDHGMYDSLLLNG